MNEEVIEPIIDQFACMSETISNVKCQIQLLQSQLKHLEKTVKKERHMFQQTRMKTHTNDGNKQRKPSGFAMPTKVSSELCQFLNKSDGTEVARTEVTKSVVAYIKDHNLQSTAEKKNIITPDDKLKTLLGLGDQDTLTYFSLQKYMNKHFIKPDVCVELITSG